MPPTTKTKPDDVKPDAVAPAVPDRAELDRRRGITADQRKILDTPKLKALLQLGGDLPPGETPMSRSEIEAALERQLERHELRWVQR